MHTMLKYVPMMLVLVGLTATGQVNITLLQKGDSSIYLRSVNDTLSYISFTDPDNINRGSEAAYFERDPSGYEFERKPMRSYLLLAGYMENDTLFFREIFTKHYLNPSVEYSTEASCSGDELHILFEGKDLPGDGFLNTFDSLYVQIGDSSYLGDLNTTIYSFITAKRTGKFDVRVYDSQRKIDYTMPVCVKRNVNGFFIRFSSMESCIASFTYQEYLQKNIPATVKTKDGAYSLKIQFVDWLHYWKTNEIRYYMAPLTL